MFNQISVCDTWFREIVHRRQRRSTDSVRRLNPKSRAVGKRSRTLHAVLVAAILQSLLATANSFDSEASSQPDDIRIIELQGTVEFAAAGATKWVPAFAGQSVRALDRVRTQTKSRVAFRWSDQTIMAFGASTELEVLPLEASGEQHGLHLIRGLASFFHRDRPGRIRVMTRGAVAGVEGTEFLLAVNDTDRTTLSVIDGTVRFGNSQAMLVLTNGEQAFTDVGGAPMRTPGFIANNLLQWSFYYPAVLDLDELSLTPQEQTVLSASLRAYREGDLLEALTMFPSAQQGASESERIYHAALLLSVGQVEQTENEISSISGTNGSGRGAQLCMALRQLISAVKRQPDPSIGEPRLSSELLSKSYYEQSRAIAGVSLRNALALARRSADQSPEFGFAWERVAELEFSFGHTKEATEALGKSLALSPRNAQALALNGFLMAARNKTREGITWFDNAIEVDSSLGSAWLGRGLSRIWVGDAGGREDLLVAAALEPQRAELRSYLGKAYASAGDYRRAAKELLLAMKEDPNDPTAWFYTALLEQQENQINAAIRDLEKSESLNENRGVYRSQMLLDQDRAVRSANLAGIYQDAGMSDTAIREAQRAVDSDYANYSAHLFLANSYSQLVDPNDIGLRYETAEENEYLLANLLSPAAAGAMSQTISQQEYTRFFDGDRMGVASQTEFLSRGAWSEAGAQYGIEGNFSYNLEGDYYYDPGQRANNDFQYRNLSATVKQQFTPNDSGYMRVQEYEADGGDLHQYYSPAMASPNYRFQESQEPNLTLGYNHEWNPGYNTLFLFTRLNDTYSFTNPAQPALVEFTPEIKPGVTKTTSVQGITMNEIYQNQLSIYSGELQHIWQTSEHDTIIGGRAQAGNFETATFQDLPSALPAVFHSPPGSQDASTYFERVTLYGYHQWRIFDALQFVGGLTYDWMTFPANFQTAPVSENEARTSRLSPKAGLILTPTRETTIRFAYARSLGGASVDQSYQIEPSEIAGFIQSFRSIVPESVAAESPGAGFETFGLSLEQKFVTGTYVSLDGQLLNSKAPQIAGAFDLSYPEVSLAVPSGMTENLDYHEKSLQLTAYQPVASDWTLGAQYRISQSILHNDFPDIPEHILSFDFEPNQRTEATLRQAELFVVFNHPSGFFARGEALWNGQNSAGYEPGLASDYFWQFNAFVGYRFLHRRAEARLGLLNMSDQYYNLNPLNPHQEYPYYRTIALRLRLNF
jgi:Tfp pilus assembly protein PilF